jgi:branched-chain amino acid transport system substrate-binding protein
MRARSAILLSLVWFLAWLPVARADVLIAAAGPVTGPLAGLGEQMLAGVRQAVDDINARGGVLGEKLQLEIGDDSCDPKQAVTVANALSAKEARLVVGHFCSGSSIPAAQVYTDEEVVMISPASTSPALTESGSPFVFRVCGRDDKQGEVAGRFIAARFAAVPIAILHDRSTYGKGLAEATRAALGAAGITEALFDAYTAGERDYAALVSKMKRAGIGAVFVGGYHTEAGLILRQMREQGMNAALIGGDALVVREFWGIAGEAAEDATFSFVVDPRQSPAAADLVARFAAKGQSPEGYVLYSYAAVEAWARAAERAGSTEPEQVARALHEARYETVIGSLAFDAKGDVDLPAFVMYRWSKGDYGPVAP